MNKIVASCLLAIGGLSMYAQSLQEKVLFTVAEDTVTAGEYMAVYNKNRNLGEDIDPKTPREYLDMYINFKLKVHEAKAMGMDTMPGFIREYGSYRDQLAKPYLNDKDVTEDLVEEAWQRMQQDVRASHIMIAIPQGATPKDTLEAYNKILSLKKKIEKGASFEEIAKQMSADTYSAKNGGDLGYFTVFNMVYPFESAAYKADIGEMVGPVKTRFGYHLVKTTDKRPARGEILVKHILLLANDKTDEAKRNAAARKIQEIYQELEKGADFATLARQYSEDKTSAEKGGELFPFGINKMYSEFEDAAFALENKGDYSKPVKTEIGWHIIQLEAKYGIGSKEEALKEIRSRLERDERSQQSRISIIKKLKKEYGFREYPSVRKQAFDQVDDSWLTNGYKVEKIRNADKVLFEFANREFTIEDFINYLLANQRGVKTNNKNAELSKAYSQFSDAMLIAFEKKQLEKKYPEFALLNREYYEGILLFDLTEKKVWKKSVTDTTGLKQYFNDHQQDYQWNERYKAYVIDAASAKLAKKAVKLLKKGNTIENVESELNANSELNVKIDSSVYELGSQSEFNTAYTETGFGKIKETNGRYQVVGILGIIPAGSKQYEEARGMVISDYQNYLERKWIEELKSDYTVKVNDDVLEKVINELESES